MRQINFLLIILFVMSVSVVNSFGRVSGLQKQAKVRAPELAGGVSWLNTNKPLSLAALRGKVVMLDFWTYGCINCIHIIPDLKKLEAKYQKNLVVIGVHSAKFDNEKDNENIRKIILRYGIEHPIVNDADFAIWNAYAVSAYPTRVLIDPAGYDIGRAVGEGHYEELDAAIQKTIDEFRKKGQLNEQPVKLALESAKVGNLPLAFPGKVLADEKSNRLFIADSNHNRLVVTDLNGKMLDTIGSGAVGKTDGDFKTATFNRPQGMVLSGDKLFVADTENHLIRLVDLQSKTVKTIAGTGSIDEFNGQGGASLKTGLRSPWDLQLVGNNLFVAMAGSHQIWRMDTEKNIIEPYAGTRAEARYDGQREESAFAQPSGLIVDGEKLFVADSESNIIREINLKKETVETLVGGDLYDFGDKDGEGDDVRLQHPLGVALYDGKVLIADTYNHKIKMLDPNARTVSTFLGNGKAGQTDGAKAQFYEPGGLSVAGDKLYIADTNNQAIRVVDLKTKTVSTLKIENLTPPEAINRAEAVAPNLKEIKIDAKTVAANSANTLNFQINLPAGFHLNPTAPQSLEISTDSAQTIKIAVAKQRFKKLPLSVSFQTASAGATNLRAKMTVYYCREDNTGVCLIKTLRWQIPLKIVNAKSAKNKIDLTETLTAGN